MASDKNISVNASNAATNINAAEIKTEINTPNLNTSISDVNIKANLVNYGEVRKPDATLFKFLEDFVTISESFSGRAPIRNAVDNLLNISEQLRRNIGKQILITASINETNAKYIRKALTEVVSTIENIELKSPVKSAVLDLFTIAETRLLGFGKTLEETTAVIDNFAKSLNSIATDRTISYENLRKSFGTFLFDSTINIENIRLSTNKRENDTINNSEVFYKYFRKNPKDTTTGIEQIGKSVSKEFEDFLLVFDNIIASNRGQYSAAPSDGSSLSDTKLITLIKNLVETINTPETLKKEYYKVLTDLVSTVENFSAQKSSQGATVATDNATISEIRQLLINSFKTENIVTTESTTIAFNKRPLDYVNFVENLIKILTRQFTDLAIVNEQFQPLYSAIKSDNVSQTDSNFQNIGKNPIETINTSETKTAHKQNYAGAGYFFSDYVGNNYTL